MKQQDVPAVSWLRCPLSPRASAQRRVSWSRRHAETAKWTGEEPPDLQSIRATAATNKQNNNNHNHNNNKNYRSMFLTTAASSTWAGLRTSTEITCPQEKVMAHNESSVALNGTQVSLFWRPLLPDSRSFISVNLLKIDFTLRRS